MKKISILWLIMVLANISDAQTSLNLRGSFFAAKADSKPSILGSVSDTKARGYSTELRAVFPAKKHEFLVGFGLKTIESEVLYKTHSGGLASSILFSFLTGRIVDTYRDEYHLARQTITTSNYLFIPLSMRFRKETSTDACLYLEAGFVVNVPIATHTVLHRPTHEVYFHESVMKIRDNDPRLTSSSSFVMFSLTPGIELRHKNYKLSPSLSIPFFRSESKTISSNIKLSIGVNLEVGYVFNKK